MCIFQTMELNSETNTSIFLIEQSGRTAIDHSNVFHLALLIDTLFYYATILKPSIEFPRTFACAQNVGFTKSGHICLSVKFCMEQPM